MKITHKGRAVPARIVDAGDALVEVDPGDWAILKVKEPIDLPALDLNLAHGSTSRIRSSASGTITRRIIVDGQRRAADPEQPGDLL